MIKIKILILILLIIPTFIYAESIENINHNLTKNYNLSDNEVYILADIKSQKLHLLQNTKKLKTYDISTSKYGTGSVSGSNKTPKGVHRIYKKFGDNAKRGTIFKSCINTKRIAKIYTDKTDSEEDFITSRIMWLDGLEESNKNSMQRRIYIHGTPEEGLIGTPSSHGCIRMKNKDVIELYTKTKESTLVIII